MAPTQPLIQQMITGGFNAASTTSSACQVPSPAAEKPPSASHAVIMAAAWSTLSPPASCASASCTRHAAGPSDATACSAPSSRGSAGKGTGNNSLQRLGLAQWGQCQAAKREGETQMQAATANTLKTW